MVLLIAVITFFAEFNEQGKINFLSGLSLLAMCVMSVLLGLDTLFDYLTGPADDYSEVSTGHFLPLHNGVGKPVRRWYLILTYANGHQEYRVEVFRFKFLAQTRARSWVNGHRFGSAAFVEGFNHYKKFRETTTQPPINRHW